MGGALFQIPGWRGWIEELRLLAPGEGRGARKQRILLNEELDLAVDQSGDAD